MSSNPHPPTAPEGIDRFRGEFAFLSNFHRHPFEWRGHLFATAEHAFQSAKSRDERERARIREAASPAEAKRLGRRADLRCEWERIKDDVMHSVLRAKFAVPELRDALLATGDAELVEGNAWGDTYWGVCGGRGRNQLGRTLMRIRDDIRRRTGRTDAHTCPWQRCPHRPSGHVTPPVLEDQASHGVVASTWPPGGPPAGRAVAAPSARRRRGRPRRSRGCPPTPRPRGTVRSDYDVVEFPHALIAAQLDAAQEEGYGYGYEHAMESACERLRENGRLPAATAALHCLARRHPDLFADTVRYLFGVDRDIAAAVTESVRLGHALDEPLDAALNAAGTAEAAP